MIFPGQKVSNTLLEKNRGQVYIILVHVMWLDCSQMDIQILVCQETKREFRSAKIGIQLIHRMPDLWTKGNMKFAAVRIKMSKLNFDILGINKLRWIGIGYFISEEYGGGQNKTIQEIEKPSLLSNESQNLCSSTQKFLIWIQNESMKIIDLLYRCILQ